MTDWTGVRDRVLALAAAPGNDKAFGAGAHDFALDAPLTAAEVADLEAWLKVDLPEDYRSLLVRILAERPLKEEFDVSARCRTLRAARPGRRGLRSAGLAGRHRIGTRPDVA
ncbi:hypothetical protein [Streptomyces sp. NPDC085540]|uniref:hypothetical protein n=1 Tax=Streptomyces sp. NPDC085540 TaxID=3365730 RepID=UPI0037D5CD32